VVTEQAREALKDCRYAWNRLEASTNTQEFRILWVAGVALVRMVGDVLDKVDSHSDPALKCAIQEAYHTRQKSDPLYSGFIKCERDQLIHRYETAIYEGSCITLGVEDAGVVEMFALDECIYKPMESGPFAGEDGRDVLKSAIDWWDAELEWIDARTNEIRST
jgi:hypothetical protein